jgi:hypothetical protein
VNQHREQSDDLQSIWQAGDSKFSEGEINMYTKLLREKRRSLHDFVQSGNSNTYLLALSFTPLFASLAWKTRAASLMLTGNLIVTVVLLVGALATWFYQRSERNLDGADLSIRDFHVLLLQFINRTIRFSKGIKYWFAPALFLGISLAAYPALNHYLAGIACVGVLALVFVLFEFAVWCMQDSGRVAELERRKSEVECLLKEMSHGD